MRIEWLFAFSRHDPLARPVWQHPEALLVVHQVRFHDLIEHVLMHSRIEERNERLDPSIEIALHEVRGRNENTGFRMRESIAGAKGINARVLQESSDDRLHSDVVRQPGHARPQATNSSNHHVNLHAGTTSRIKSVNDLRVDKRVAFHPDLRRPAKRGMVDLVGDVAQQSRL